MEERHDPHRRTLLGGAAGAAGAAALGTRRPPRPRPRVRRRWSAPPPRTPCSTSCSPRTRNTGVGWTGADSTYSAKLPGGREMWIFSDTFLGPVNPDGGRPMTAPFINNSVIVQRGTRLTTVTGTPDGEPAGIFRPETAGNWYWMGPNLVTGKIWQQIVNEYEKTGPGGFDLAYVRHRGGPGRTPTGWTARCPTTRCPSLPADHQLGRLAAADRRTHLCVRCRGPRRGEAHARRPGPRHGPAPAVASSGPATAGRPTRADSAAGADRRGQRVQRHTVARPLPAGHPRHHRAVQRADPRLRRGPADRAVHRPDGRLHAHRRPGRTAATATRTSSPTTRTSTRSTAPTGGCC